MAFAYSVTGEIPSRITFKTELKFQSAMFRAARYSFHGKSHLDFFFKSMNGLKKLKVEIGMNMYVYEVVLTSFS